MFGELPKVLGRNFVIGFFLPVSLFGFGNIWLSKQCDARANTVCHSIAVTRDIDFAQLQNLAFFILLVWLMAVALLSLNRSVYRMFEGYGRGNPYSLVRFLEQRRYNRMASRIDVLSAQARAATGEARQALLVHRGKLMYQQAWSFPERGRLLPTRVGNAIRAFEDYSSVMYGFDAIAGWPRLLTVIPDEYVALVDDAKAQTDFWLNLWLLSLVVAGEYLLLLPDSADLRPRWWVPVLCIAFAWIASRRATQAVFGWGEMVKAAFDVFLPELRSKLQLSPERYTSEREMWADFSLAISYRKPEKLPPRRHAGVPAPEGPPDSPAAVLNASPRSP